MGRRGPRDTHDSRQHGANVNGKQSTAKSGLWKQLAGIAAAILLLWLAFRGMDMQQFMLQIKRIQPLLILPLFISALVSHFLRALRWVILLRPVSEKPVSLWNSFCAVMIGYAVNLAIPRGGEVARLVSISRTENLPWAGVLPTMFIDRLIDIAVLAILLGFTLIFFPTSATSSLPWLVPGGVMLSISAVLGLFALPKMADLISWLVDRQWTKSHLPARILEAIARLSEQFHTGTQSLSSPGAYPAITALSVGIWFFYWLNYYIMIWAFGLQQVVSPAQCLVVFTIGSVGVLVPTPGSIGSMHFLVSQGLVMVSGVHRELALAFATVLHMFSFVVVNCLGAAVCVAIQSSRNKGRLLLSPEPDHAVPQPDEAR